MTATRTLVVLLSLSCAFLLGREFAHRGIAREIPGPGYSAQVAEATRAAQRLDASAAASGTTFVEVADRLRPSVVSIWGRSEGGISSGTGLIVSPDGAILTNYHVIEDLTEIIVTLSSLDRYPATVIGQDEPTDLALVKIEGVSGLLPATFGDSDAIRVGEDNLAIGNPLGFGWTVTRGIISSLHRSDVAVSRDPRARRGPEPYTDFIQTDAAITFGNSGGPIVNSRGEVIGISTAIVGSSGGIGFAIPANDARFVANELLQTGKVRRGFLGIIGKDLSDLQNDERRRLAPGALGGFVVDVVEQDTPADRSGIRKDDVILALDGRAVESFSVLRNRIARVPPATEVSIKVVRNGREMEMRAVVGERPSEAR